MCAFSLSLSFFNIKSLCAYEARRLNRRAGPRERQSCLAAGSPGQHRPEPFPPPPSSAPCQQVLAPTSQKPIWDHPAMLQTPRSSSRELHLHCHRALCCCAHPSARSFHYSERRAGISRRSCTIISIKHFNQHHIFVSFKHSASFFLNYFLLLNACCSGRDDRACFPCPAGF